MIVHLPPTYSRLVSDELKDGNFFYSVMANREQSRNAFNNRIGLDERALVDFEWHSPDDQDADWVDDSFGSRDHLRARTTDRGAFIEIANRLSDAPLLVPSGRADRVTDSLRFAREAVDSLPAGSEVWATVTLTRPGLTDPQVVMQINQLHREISGIYVVVYDNAGFPAAWTSPELVEYLKLVGAQVLTGRDTIAAHSDVRGLLATALGALHVGTGVTKAMKQYAAPSTGGGAQPGQPPPPTASYVSLPLLSTMHGDRAEAILGAEVDRIESHHNSLADCHLATLPAKGDAWGAWQNPVGNANASRGLLSLQAISAAESQLQSAPNPADAMEKWLDDAAELAQEVPAEAFQTPGLRTEVMARPGGFREARAFLGI